MKYSKNIQKVIMDEYVCAHIAYCSENHKTNL